MRFFLLTVFLLLPYAVAAQTGQTQQAGAVVGEVTKLPLPRFVSVRSDRVYARTGPGTRYPIKWVYQRDNLPVEIVQEFDTWRKIRDKDGEEGWVHQSLLSGKRFGIVNTEQAVPLLKRTSDDSPPVALIESGVIVMLDSCENHWCHISVSGFNGWLSYDSLWGIYEGEGFE